MKHLAIKNGTIIDGTGAPPYKGDLVFVEEKIAEVGHDLDLPAQMPAAVMGIGDRGTLEPGKKADIVIFNPDKLKDTATYAQPHQYAEGIEYVWVNGKMVIERGKRTHRRPGKVLKYKKNA